MSMVSLKDYEGMAGFGGFGLSNGSEVEDLNKALSAGHQSPRVDGGAAMRVESLEATLRVLTYNQTHVKMWRDIPKLPAYSTVEEYTVQTAYGASNGAFTKEGELPQTQDSGYERRSALVKFLGTQREVTHPMTLVKPAHGNLIAQETQAGALWLMENLERALFKGNATAIPESFDGIEQQFLADGGAASRNIIDLRGGTLSEYNVEDATNLIIENYGVPTDLYAAPKALSTLNKTLFPRERFNHPNPTNGTVGMAINAIETQGGIVNLKGNIFLRSGTNAGGARTAPAAATATRAPTAPTVSGAATASLSSSFTAADVGTFQYKVTAVNRFGETAGAQESGGVAVAAAGDGVTLTITDGGGADPATAYNIYRSLVGGAVGTEVLIHTVPRAGATTVWIDVNTYLPSCSNAYMMQMNLQALSFRQLAPMMKIPLATIAASIRWMQLIYGTPILYQPRKMVLFRNVKDS